MQYTGGTVLHLYLGEQIKDVEIAKQLIRKAFTNYKAALSLPHPHLLGLPGARHT